jgi:predicted dienelactone hydrolase
VADRCPSKRRAYPIVLLSHGSTSVNLALGWLGAFLAEHGYIVAAVNHHGNTGAEGGRSRRASWHSGSARAT